MPFDIAGALGAGYSSEEITDYLKAHPTEADHFDVAGALKAGYSPDEVVDHLNGKVEGVQSIPVLAPLDRGIAHLWEQGANLATDMGAPGLGSAIRGRLPQAVLHARTSGQDLVGDLQSGHYLSAIGDLPSAALEQTVPVVGGALAGVASGGSIPATLAAGAGIGALTQGDAIARQRAANNGRAAPSGTDLALGLAGGAGAGAAGAAGLNVGGGGGLGAAALQTLAHVGGDAAQPELASLAGSVGTDKGAQNASPAEMVGAGLTGLATRGALSAPQISDAVAARTPSGRAAALSSEYTGMSPEDQQAVLNRAAAGKILQDATDSAVPLPTESRPSAVARTAGDLLDRRMADLTSTLDASGALPDGGLDTINAAWKNAANQQRTLLTGDLDAIDKLGLDQDDAQTIKDTLQQRAMLTDAGVMNRGSGTLSWLAGVAGRGLGFAGGAMVNHPFVGSEIGGAAGRKIGDELSSRLGLMDPTLVKSANNAQAMLQASNVPVPDTFAKLQDAIGKSRDVVDAQARLMGLDPSNLTTPGLVKAMDDKFSQDYSNAQFDNRQVDSQANFQRSQEVSDALAMDRQRTQQQNSEMSGMVSDALAMDRQRTQQQNSEMSGMVSDALAMDRQRTQDLNFQRAQEVGDASAINRAQDRSMSGLERQGNTVAMIAYRRMVAEKGLSGTPTVAAARAAPDAAPASPPDPTPGSPVAVAVARAARNAPAPGAAQDLTAPMPNMDGLSPVAKAQGALLPEWQYGLGKNLLDALNLRGTPKNLNMAQEVSAAVDSMRQRGMFDQQFSDRLMNHQGRVVRGLYNVIRNEMLMNHGIDMRTLAAQSADSPMSIAAQ